MQKDLPKAIRSEEIVMPPEQSGIVTDNFRTARGRCYYAVVPPKMVTIGLHPPNDKFDTAVFDLP